MAYVEGDGRSEVSINEVGTGRVTAIVESPRNSATRVFLSATADPHVFYMAWGEASAPEPSRTGKSLKPGDLSPADNRVFVRRLTIDEAGRVRASDQAATFSSDSYALNSFAASPDGSRIALALVKPTQIRGKAGLVAIDVLHLSTGRRHTLFRGVGGRVDSLSWAANGRRLAFQLLGTADGADGAWVLDLSSDGQRATPRHVFSWDTPDLDPGQYTTPVLSADGRYIYLIANVARQGRGITRILELDATTGRRQGVLYEQPYSGRPGTKRWDFDALALDPTGTSLLVVDGHGVAHRVNIATRHMTAFPFSWGLPNSLAW
jgi:hypothetical protein